MDVNPTDHVNLDRTKPARIPFPMVLLVTVNVRMGVKPRKFPVRIGMINKFITMMTRTVTFIENGQRRRKKEEISCDDACGGPYFGKRCYEDCGIFDPKTEKHKKNLQWTFDSRCTIKVDCPICAEVSDAALFIDGTTTCTPTEVDDQSNFQYNSATLNTVHRLGAALVGVAVACLL